MTRLPIVGGDVNAWGTILNQFLQVAHNASGTLKGAFSTYNVMDDAYGATGNGITDDTAACQAAINAANSAGGGIVFFPLGTYLISGLTIPGNNISLVGTGWGSIIRLKNSANVYAIVFSNGTNGVTGGKFADLKIDGNCTNQTAGGCLDANGAYLYTWDRVWFINPYEAGMQLRFGPGGGFGFQNNINRCQFTNGYLSAGVGRGLWINNTDENHITDCHFQDNGGATSNDNVHVRDDNGLSDYKGCDFVGNGHGAGGIKLYSTNGSRISQCIFDGVRQGNIIMSGSNNNIVDCCRFLNIGYNAVSPNTADGIYSSGTGNIIVNNFFNPEGSGTNGCKAQIELDVTSGAASNIIANNYFSTANTGGFTLLIDGSPTGNIIGPNQGFDKLPWFNVTQFGATGNGTSNDTTPIQNAITAAQAVGGVVYFPPGTYLISSTLTVTAASVTLLGAGIAATTITTTTTGIDGIKIGNTQVTPFTQLNNIVLRDFTVNLPNASTGSCLNVTGMGEGGEITNVKAQQGKYGFLLEDIDRCVFRNLEAVNQNTVSIVCRQGENNTWGTATFINCHSVLNTASTIGLQFDNDTVTQLSPNKFDRVTFINHHFFANTGLTGSLGVKFVVGATATTFLNCLYENTLRHNDIEAEVDASWNGCSFLNTNFATTPTTDGWYLNSYAQISIYDCNLQQMTNLFNGNAGSPRVGVFGMSKNGGNITNMFAGASYGAKHGTDTDLVGANALAVGINGSPLGFVFTQNITLNQKSNLSSGTGAPSGGSSGDYYFRQDTPGTANQRVYVNNAGTWTGII